jgi:multidrug efflux pump subunit AcrA (membrane-fusion protein)
MFAVSVRAQTPFASSMGEMLLFESNAAVGVSEKVRAQAPGVLMEVFVKPGDYVIKGQILAHTELDAAKLHMDLTKRALENKTNVESAKAHADAWRVAREETEEQVRRRRAEKTRLEWAISMEKMHQANYEAQLELEKVQEVQYFSAKQQFEKRFLRATVHGVVTEKLVDVGKPVNFATHVFTISNQSAFSIPVPVPAPVAAAVKPNETIPVRSADGNVVKRAVVDSVTDSPRSAGEKIVRLLVESTDFPMASRSSLAGMKFDVLMPQLALNKKP